MVSEKDDKKRDDILKKMLEAPPKPNKPIKEKESAKDHDNDRDLDG